jgi:hypothetical protein
MVRNGFLQISEYRGEHLKYASEIVALWPVCHAGTLPKCKWKLRIPAELRLVTCQDHIFGNRTFPVSTQILFCHTRTLEFNFRFLTTFTTCSSFTLAPTMLSECKFVLAFNYAPRNEDLWGGGCTDPVFLTSTIFASELSGSRPGHSIPVERAPDTNRMRDWVNPRGVLDAVDDRKFLTVPRLELQTLGCPICSQSPHRLQNPSPFFATVYYILFVSFAM